MIVRQFKQATDHMYPLCIINSLYHIHVPMSLQNNNKSSFYLPQKNGNIPSLEYTKQKEFL